MWHDLKILLRELMTTIYGSTMQRKVMETTSNDNKHSATDNVDTLVEATQQLIQHTLPGNRSTDRVTNKGSKTKGITHMKAYNPSSTTYRYR